MESRTRVKIGIFLVAVMLIGAMSADSASAAPYENKLVITDPADGKKSYFDELKKDISDAKKSIHVNMYLLEYKNNSAKDYPPNVILKEIVKAKNDGVDIRISINQATLVRHPDTVPYLIQNGLPHKTTGTHAKVIVIDEEIAYIGSSNWNWRGFKYNLEANIKTENPAIVKKASIFLDRVWGITIPSSPTYNSPGEELLIGQNYLNDLRVKLDSATEKINLMMYDAHYNPNIKDFPTILLDAVKNATARGVKVQVLLDDGIIKTRPNLVDFLKSSNIPFRVDKNEPVMEKSNMIDFMEKNKIQEDQKFITHSKLVIVDDTVYLGSHNWTIDQLKSRGDVTMKTNDPKMVSKYLDEFYSAWSEGKTL